MKSRVLKLSSLLLNRSQYFFVTVVDMCYVGVVVNFRVLTDFFFGDSRTISDNFTLSTLNNIYLAEIFGDSFWILGNNTL